MNPKLQICISPTETECSTIYDRIATKYKLYYCGLYKQHEKMFLYVHGKSRMAPNVLRKVLGDLVGIINIYKFKDIDGKKIDEHGTIPRHGGSRPHTKKTTTKSSDIPPATTNIDNSDNRVIINNNNNTDNRVAISNFFPVALNPISRETIDHISSDDMNSCYDDPTFNGVIMNFSNHLYRIKENLNIRCSSKSSTCKAYTESGWLAKHKDEGYDVIYDNLTRKSLEAMEKHRADIPDEMIKKHENEVDWMHQLRVDPEDIKPSYVQIRNSNLNLMGENISNLIRNYQARNGKRLKFS